MLLDAGSHHSRAHRHRRHHDGGARAVGFAFAAFAVWRVLVARPRARLAVENDRLVHDLSASRHELLDSRARLVTVADGERRRIERDLHDGAQQRLVAIQIRLALLREQLEQEAPARAVTVRRLEDDVETATEEVRALAHGIYPPLLSERGLTEALRAAARSAPLPTTVHMDHVGRYSADVESTVYFACMEALQNAAKHAEGATRVTIAVADNGRLRFEVRDDGVGFATGGRAYDGDGLANLHDRLAAVGGELEVDSVPGDGTCVAGAIPLR
jgi:signal transduction histidine kinase